jgi:hypothetical protein
VPEDVEEFFREAQVAVSCSGGEGFFDFVVAWNEGGVAPAHVRLGSLLKK